MNSEISHDELSAVEQQLASMMVEQAVEYRTQMIEAKTETKRKYFKNKLIRLVRKIDGMQSRM